MIDLHTHSTRSDGTDPPERIAELAAAAGLSDVALTDHDTFEGLAAARAAAEELGVNLIAGCEISTRPEGVGSCHLLVYFVDDPDSPLGRLLDRLRDDRRERNLELVERLAHLGLPVTMEELVAEAGGEANIGRPHVANVMVARGYVGSRQQAFDEVLGNGRPAYVPKRPVAPETAIEAARDSGGVAVLAHPDAAGLAPGELDAFVGRLAAAGMGGLEAIYGRYTPARRRELTELAHRHGLVATGGSDYHGANKPDLAVGTGKGDLAVPASVLEELEERLSS